MNDFVPTVTISLEEYQELKARPKLKTVEKLTRRSNEERNDQVSYTIKLLHDYIVKGNKEVDLGDFNIVDARLIDNIFNSVDNLQDLYSITKRDSA